MGKNKENFKNLQDIVFQAGALELEKKYSQAIQLLEGATTKYPLDAEALLILGRLYLIEGQPRKAEDRLYKALKEEPENPDLYLQLAIVLFSLKDHKKTVEVTSKGIEKGAGILPEEKLLHLYQLKANSLKETKNIKGAESTFKAALALTKNKGSIYVDLGRLYEVVGDLSKSEKYFEKALKDSVIDSGVYADKGRVLLRLGKLNDAIKTLSLALEKGDQSLDTLINLARAYEESGQDKEAEEILSSLKGRGSETIEYYSLLSDIYKKRGDYRRGAEALKEAIKIAPDRAFLYGDLGKMLSYMGKDEEAIKHFKKASEKDPRDGSYNYEASKIFLQRNDFDKVLIETRSALEKNYESADLYIDAAKSARSLNRLKEAEEFYLKAGEISPNSKELWFQNRIKNDIEICQRKVRLDSLPRNLGVCLTNRCNLKCLMCEVRKEDWDISPERVGEVKEFFPYIEQVLWQGGEVFLSEHFLPLFSEASSYEHLSQVVLTSGMLIDRDWAKLFATSKTEVTFSLESVHRELYEKIRVGASFNKLKENLSLLNESRSRTPDSALKINLQMLVMEDNIRELDYLIAFAKDYGARKIFLIGLDETINKKNTFYDNPIYRKELGLILNKFFAEAAEKSIEVVNSLPISGWEEEGNPKEIEDSVSELELLYENKEEDPKEIICLWPWQQLSICSGGNAVINGLCPYLIVGNIDKQAIREIWNGEKIRGVREALLGENENNPCCTELCLSGGLPLGMLRLD